MTKTKILLSVAAASVLALNGCGGGGGSDSSPTPTPTPTSETLMGTLSANKTLTADTVWKLDGKVVVPLGVTLTIEPGTKVAGLEGTEAWLMVMPGGKLMAEGTAAKPIVFTSETALNGGTEASGQWGGVTIIGNSDNDQTTTYEVDDVTQAGTGGASSGSLKYVTINNTGIAVEANKEINGLSLFGVSASTVVENITVNRSGDDGVEIWGGNVNLKNIVIDQADDDSFDTDSGWAGSVDGLTITNGKKAGIEMSGTTVATYKNVNITLDSADSEGGLYFKAGDGEVVGGVFENVTVNYNSAAKGAITVSGAFDETNSAMTNVTLGGSNPAIVAKTEADAADAAAVEAIYENQGTAASETLMGTLSANKTLTADTVWKLDGKVVVPLGVTLTIEPGTKVAGLEGTEAWLMVMPGGKLMAEGTAAKPIVFTSETALNGGTEASGQWGGVTIIGNSDNDQTTTYEVDDVTQAGTGGASSGSLKYVTINNTGIAVEANKEINGLSLFGVSASTVVENITVNRSGDDGVEIWGGNVNLKNIVIDQADDDSFDTDSGWAGSVDGLTITNGKKAGIEMSGTTVATYKNVNITLDSADSEGGLYFKAGDGEVVGGVFENVTVNYNSAAKGAITVSGAFDETNSAMTNVTLGGSNPAIVAKTEADAADAAEVQAIYDAQ